MSAACLLHPKKPAGGAFGQWVRRNKHNLKFYCAGLDACGFAALATRMWRACPEGEKAEYQLLFDQAMDKWRVDKEKFIEAGGIWKQGRKARRAERNDDKISSGFGAFCAEFILEKKKNNTLQEEQWCELDFDEWDVAKEAVAEWLKVSGKKKVQFSKKAEDAAMIVQFENDFKKFGKKMSEEVRSAAAAQPGGPKAAKVKKPWTGGYGCYVRANRDQIQSLVTEGRKGSFHKIASAQWQAMTEVERKPYKTQYDKSIKAHQKAAKAKYKAAKMQDKECVAVNPWQGMRKRADGAVLVQVVGEPESSAPPPLRRRLTRKHSPGPGP